MPTLCLSTPWRSHFCGCREPLINLAPLFTLAAAFSIVPLYFDQKVDDILDPNQTSLPVARDDLSPLVLVNKVGAPWRFFPPL